MTTDKSSVRILIYNDCGTEKFLNVFFPVYMWSLLVPQWIAHIQSIGNIQRYFSYICNDT